VGRLDPPDSLDARGGDGAPRTSFPSKRDGRRGPRERFTNRPGFNAYLKVVLDDDALDRLHRAARSVRDRVAQRAEQASAGNNEDGGSRNVNHAEPSAILPTPESVSLLSDDQRIKNEGKSSREVDNVNRTDGILKVKPRSRESLHMTLFFGGEALGRVPKEDLVSFHACVSAVLRGEPYRFVQDENGRGESPEAGIPEVPGGCDDRENPVRARGGAPSPKERKDPSRCFRILELRTFPPRRNNLIVATLEAPEIWNRVHESILLCADSVASSSTAEAAAATPAIANTESCIHTDNTGTVVDSEPRVTLRDIGAVNPPRWIPHVTLANLVVGRRNGDRKRPNSQMRVLDEILREETRRLLTDPDRSGTESRDGGDLEEEEDPSLAFGKGVAMGGPVPPQAPLDWKFHFSHRLSRNDKEVKADRCVDAGGSRSPSQQAKT
jgi:hypothetical protein